MKAIRVWRTSDGQTYESKADAEAHDQRLKAEAKVQAAEAKVQAAKDAAEAEIRSIGVMCFSYQPGGSDRLLSALLGQPIRFAGVLMRLGRTLQRLHDADDRAKAKQDAADNEATWAAAVAQKKADAKADAA